MMRSQVFALISLVVLLQAAGCDPAALAPQGKSGSGALPKALSQVGYLYMNYHDVHGQGPANWDELATMAEGDAEAQAGIETVRGAGYDLKWGVRFRDVTGGMANTVLGQSPQGGPKLMFDGSIQQ